jgi:hypothetical protein
MHGERSDSASSLSGTFEDIKEAQAYATKCLCDFNEIIDTNTWQVIWRLNKSTART